MAKRNSWSERCCRNTNTSNSHNKGEVYLWFLYIPLFNKNLECDHSFTSCCIKVKWSSLLEIECLDWEGKGKSKKQCKPNKHSCSYAYKVISIPKITPNKLFHSLSSIYRFFYILYVLVLNPEQFFLYPKQEALLTD